MHILTHIPTIAHAHIGNAAVPRFCNLILEEMRWEMSWGSREAARSALNYGIQKQIALLSVGSKISPARRHAICCHTVIFHYCSILRRHREAARLLAVVSGWRPSRGGCDRPKAQRVQVWKARFTRGGMQSGQVTQIADKVASAPSPAIQPCRSIKLK